MAQHINLHHNHKFLRHKFEKEKEKESINDLFL